MLDAELQLPENKIGNEIAECIRGIMIVTKQVCERVLKNKRKTGGDRRFTG